MNFEEVAEFSVIGVRDRGVPNRERIILVALESIDLGAFALVMSREQEDGFFRPLSSNFFWLEDAEISVGNYVIIYTGKGHSRWTTIRGTNAPAYVTHLGGSRVLFEDQAIVPLLTRIGAMTVLR